MEKPAAYPQPSAATPSASAGQTPGRGRRASELAEHSAYPHSHTAVAFHAVALPPDSSGDAPAWIHLIPSGEFSGRDGRGPYTLDADAVTAAFAARNMPLAIDYEHQSIHSTDNGQPAPAAGWIKTLEAREDGIWGQVEWTSRAAEMIANKEYRYLSPVFEFEEKSGRVFALAGAGLTNHPNLFLTAIHRLNPFQFALHTEGTDMNEELLERLRYFFNLPTLANVEEVIAELDKLRDQLAAPETAAMRQSLSLPEDAGLPQIMTAAVAFDFAAHKAAAPSFDPAEFVPRVEYDRLLAEHKARADEEIIKTVEAAIHAEKITPSEKDWALDYCRKDAEGFARHVASRPPIGLSVHNQSASRKPDTHTVNPLLADAQRRIEGRHPE
ncbi:MAG: phage protease [Zoogloeaceae bacterium]|jgi:phage I-like protein|nr:phage protease [Zoogloeaceae bacterium]